MGHGEAWRHEMMAAMGAAAAARAVDQTETVVATEGAATALQAMVVTAEATVW